VIERFYRQHGGSRRLTSRERGSIDMTDNRGHSVTLDTPIEKKIAKERERNKRRADEVGVASDDSFPASDPPSFNPGITGASDVDRKK
jgi:hypothetical protein